MDSTNPKVMRVGISGGTFDPIHIGHLIIAQEVKDEFNLDKVFFIPVGKPPHKDVMNVTHPQDRLNMVEKAVFDNEKFEVLNLEINRSGYTYAVDTLKELNEKYKNTKFYYIIGADVVLDILSWKDYNEIFGLCEFIAVLRPNFDIDIYNERIKTLKENYAACIHTFKASLIDISSTVVRQRAKKGKSIKYFVTKPVEEYIVEKGLYR